MKVRKEVEELDPYVPGRSKEEIAQEFGVKKEDIIKLGSNENPWGPSPKVICKILKCKTRTNYRWRRWCR